MEIGTQIFIAPCSHARQRTKNRIREHGAGGFKVRDIVEHCDCLNGASGVLLVASDGWLGWLRTEEIIIDSDNINQSGSVSDAMLTEFFGEMNRLASLATFTVVPLKKE